MPSSRSFRVWRETKQSYLGDNIKIIIFPRVHSSPRTRRGKSCTTLRLHHINRHTLCAQIFAAFRLLSPLHMIWFIFPANTTQRTWPRRNAICFSRLESGTALENANDGPYVGLYHRGPECDYPIIGSLWAACFSLFLVRMVGIFKCRFCLDGTKELVRSKRRARCVGLVYDSQAVDCCTLLKGKFNEDSYNACFWCTYALFPSSGTKCFILTH